MASDTTRYTNRCYDRALPLLKTIANDVPELKRIEASTPCTRFLLWLTHRTRGDPLYHRGWRVDGQTG